MKRILKWSIPVDGKRHKIGGGRVTHVACQIAPNEVQVWTEEFTGKAMKKLVEAEVLGTGHTYPEDGVAVGSYPLLHLGSPIVWHVVVYSKAKEE